VRLSVGEHISETVCSTSRKNVHVSHGRLGALRYVIYFRFYDDFIMACDATKQHTQSDSTRGGTDLSPRRIVKLTHQWQQPTGAESATTSAISWLTFHVDTIRTVR